VTVDLHAQHRPYLAALADGELELVPAETQEHVADCEQCRAELDAHQLLGQRLRAAAREVAPEPVAAAASRRSFILPLAAAAAIAIVIGGAVLATRSQVPDPLASAVLVAAQKPQYTSSDPTDIAGWCTAKYGNRVPVVNLSGLQPQGARMDWPHDVGVATVTYHSVDSATIHVSWLSVAEGGPQPEVLSIDGKPAVLVRRHGITALVTGNATQSELVHVAQEVADIL